ARGGGRRRSRGHPLRTARRRRGPAHPLLLRRLVRCDPRGHQPHRRLDPQEQGVALPRAHPSVRPELSSCAYRTAAQGPYENNSGPIPYKSSVGADLGRGNTAPAARALLKKEILPCWAFCSSSALLCSSSSSA